MLTETEKLIAEAEQGTPHGGAGREARSERFRLNPPKPVLVKKTIYYPSRLIEELYSDGHTEIKQAGNGICGDETASVACSAQKEIFK